MKDDKFTQMRDNEGEISLESITLYKPYTRVHIKAYLPVSPM